MNIIKKYLPIAVLICAAFLIINIFTPIVSIGALGEIVALSWSYLTFITANYVPGIDTGNMVNSFGYYPHTIAQAVIPVIIFVLFILIIRQKSVGQEVSRNKYLAVFFLGCAYLVLHIITYAIVTGKYNELAYASGSVYSALIKIGPTFFGVMSFIFVSVIIAAMIYVLWGDRFNIDEKLEKIGKKEKKGDKLNNGTVTPVVNAGSGTPVRETKFEEEETVTVLKSPDAEITFTNESTDDEERTVIISAGNMYLIRLSTGEKIEPDKAEFVIGRSAEKADFRVGNPAISSRHVQLTSIGGEIFAEDLGSSNHTYVNNVQLEAGPGGRISLKDGDILKLAEEEFRVCISQESVNKPVNSSGKGVFRVKMNKGNKEMCISKEIFTIGRTGGNADVQISNDKTLGRIHARIRADENTGQVFVKDEDSANGTFINGRRLEKGEETVVKNGDELKLADLTIRMLL